MLGESRASAARAAQLIERWPGEARGFPARPRARALAILYERLGRLEEAARIARQLRATDFVDTTLLGLEVRCLSALGRTPEAEWAAAALKKLAPRSLVRPVDSPLLRGPGNIDQGLSLTGREEKPPPTPQNR